jgi:hypothetical protein
LTKEGGLRRRISITVVVSSATVVMCSHLMTVTSGMWHDEGEDKNVVVDHVYRDARP